MISPARIALTTAVSSALVACAPTTPTFDRNFSETTRALTAQQVRDPGAPVANRDRPPDALDGTVTREAINRYRHTFTEPPPAANVFTIGLGGGDAGGGSR